MKILRHFQLLNFSFQVKGWQCQLNLNSLHVIFSAYRAIKRSLLRLGNNGLQYYTDLSAVNNYCIEVYKLNSMWSVAQLTKGMCILL